MIGFYLLKGKCIINFKTKNLDFEKSAADIGPQGNMIKNGPVNAPSSSDNYSISNSGSVSATKANAYNLKVSVNKFGPS
jgi:hypothetical protein